MSCGPSVFPSNNISMQEAGLSQSFFDRGRNRVLEYTVRNEASAFISLWDSVCDMSHASGVHKDNANHGSRNRTQQAAH